MINTDRPTPPPQQPVATTQVAAVDSQALLDGAREIVIRHAGEHYRLQLTRNNRLILIK
ncbi:hemin uptake protein HemP [Neisseriaceae bacterium JH1-16]|nr:hemin uptake protein HemP [Neisseriaceae bacterium JH1-16]